MWRCLILIVSVTCQLFSCMPVQKKYYSKRKAWSYYTLFASAGNASMVVTTSITSTHGRVGTMDKNRLRLNKRSRWPRTPWIQNQEFVPSFILQMYRTSSFWSHCPHLVPATCQDDGPATLGDVSLARVGCWQKASNSFEFCYRFRSMPGSGNYVHGLTCYSCMVISRPVSCSSFNLIAQLALGPYPFPFSLSLCGFSSYVHCIYLCGELSWQATRSKDVFSKHVESVLAKCSQTAIFVRRLAEELCGVSHCQKVSGLNEWGCHSTVIPLSPSLPLKLSCK